MEILAARIPAADCFGDTFHYFRGSGGCKGLTNGWPRRSSCGINLRNVKFGTTNVLTNCVSLDVGSLETSSFAVHV